MTNTSFVSFFLKYRSCWDYHVLPSIAFFSLAVAGFLLWDKIKSCLFRCDFLGKGGGNNIYEMSYSGILLGTSTVFITGSSATDLIQTYSSIPHKTKRLEKEWGFNRRDNKNPNLMQTEKLGTRHDTKQANHEPSAKRLDTRVQIDVLYWVKMRKGEQEKAPKRYFRSNSGTGNRCFS